MWARRHHWGRSTRTRHARVDRRPLCGGAHCASIDGEIAARMAGADGKGESDIPARVNRDPDPAAGTQGARRARARPTESIGRGALARAGPPTASRRRRRRGAETTGCSISPLGRDTLGCASDVDGADAALPPCPSSSLARRQSCSVGQEVGPIIRSRSFGSGASARRCRTGARQISRTLCGTVLQLLSSPPRPRPS